MLAAIREHLLFGVYFSSLGFTHPCGPRVGQCDTFKFPPAITV